MRCLFNFAFKPADRCAFPKTKTGRKNVAWFWLTDSNYYIDLGEARLFELSEAQIHRYHPDSPFDDYFYIRQLEDLFDILPEIAHLLPVDLFAWVDTGEKWEILREKRVCMTDEQDEIFDAIGLLLNYGRLDTGYLASHPRCRFLHTGDALRIQYDFRATDEDGVPVWSAMTGQIEMRYACFVDEFGDMLTRFFQGMDRQVEDAITLSVGERYCIDPAALREEHAHRRTHFFGLFNRFRSSELPPVADWAKVRETLEKFQ